MYTMVLQDSLLVTLVKLVDRLPIPSPSGKRGRGHPRVYPDRLFRKRIGDYDCPSLT
jgi:hypothetical protein